MPNLYLILYPTKHLHRLAVLIAIALLMTVVVHAQENFSGKPVWNVEIRKELPEHDPPFYRTYINAGTNKFAFLLPLGYFVQNQAEYGVLKLGNSGGSTH